MKAIINRIENLKNEINGENRREIINSFEQTLSQTSELLVKYGKNDSKMS